MDLSGHTIGEEQLEAVAKYYCVLGPSGVPKARLNLSDTGLHDDDLRMLVAALVRLRGRDLLIEELDVSRNVLGDLGCEALCGLITPDFKVKKINLSRNIHITNEGFNVIVGGARQNSQLSGLDFEVCGIELEGPSHEALRNLLLGHISANCALTSLELGGNHVPDSFIEAVKAQLQQNKCINEIIMPSIRGKAEAKQQ